MTWRISPDQVTSGVVCQTGLGRWTTSPLIRDVPDITIAIQNCNSLNISTHCEKQLTKLIAITALCTDIIFLSDLRLHDDFEAVDSIEKIFRCNSKRNYNCYFNSSCRNRGVGILIACDLSFSILDTYHDSNSNILGLSCALTVLAETVVRLRLRLPPPAS
jgi:hypothetical protein